VTPEELMLTAIPETLLFDDWSHSPLNRLVSLEVGAQRDTLLAQEDNLEDDEDEDDSWLDEEEDEDDSWLEEEDEDDSWLEDDEDEDDSDLYDDEDDYLDEDADYDDDSWLEDDEDEDDLAA
jgi:segregation and condensation protein B